MSDNSIQIIQNLEIKQNICGFSKNILGRYPAGLKYDPKTNSIAANGKAGSLQMYRWLKVPKIVKLR